MFGYYWEKKSHSLIMTEFHTNVQDKSQRSTKTITQQQVRWDYRSLSSSSTTVNGFSFSLTVDCSVLVCFTSHICVTVVHQKLHVFTETGLQVIVTNLTPIGYVTRNLTLIGQHRRMPVSCVNIGGSYRRITRKWTR